MAAHESCEALGKVVHRLSKAVETWELPPDRPSARTPPEDVFLSICTHFLKKGILLQSDYIAFKEAWNERRRYRRGWQHQRGNSRITDSPSSGTLLSDQSREPDQQTARRFVEKYSDFSERTSTIVVLSEERRVIGGNDIGEISDAAPVTVSDLATPEHHRTYDVVAPAKAERILADPRQVAWQLDPHGFLLRINPLGRWVWQPADRDSLAGLSVFDLFAAAIQEGRLPVDENEELWDKKLPVLRYLCDYEHVDPRRYASFFAVMAQNELLWRKYHGVAPIDPATWASERVNAYPLIIYSRDTGQRLSFGGEVFQVNAGFLAVYEPSDDATIAAVNTQISRGQLDKQAATRYRCPTDARLSSEPDAAAAGPMVEQGSEHRSGPETAAAEGAVVSGAAPTVSHRRPEDYPARRWQSRAAAIRMHGTARYVTSPAYERRIQQHVVATVQPLQQEVERRKELKRKAHKLRAKGVVFNQIPQTVYPSMEYVTPRELAASGVTGYNESHIALLMRNKNVPENHQHQLAGKSVLDAAGVEDVILREEEGVGKRKQGRPTGLRKQRRPTGLKSAKT